MQNNFLILIVLVAGLVSGCDDERTATNADDWKAPSRANAENESDWRRPPAAPQPPPDPLSVESIESMVRKRIESFGLGDYENRPDGCYQIGLFLAEAEPPPHVVAMMLGSGTSAGAWMSRAGELGNGDGPYWIAERQILDRERPDVVVISYNFHEALKSNSADAKFLSGALRLPEFRGRWFDADRGIAEKLMHEGRDDGAVRALWALGVMYGYKWSPKWLRPDQRPFDLQRARELFAEAANRGYAPAMVELAWRIAEEDREQANAWLQRAAETGDANALFLAAREHPDDQIKVEWLTQSATQGHQLALLDLVMQTADEERREYLTDQALALGHKRVRLLLGQP